MEGRYATLKDPRWLYVIIIIAVSWPLLNPIGLPVAIEKWTRNAYDTIETLPEGSKVLISSTNAGSNWPDLGIPETALTRHLLKKGHKVVFFSYGTEAAVLTDTKILPVANVYGAKSGEDYVLFDFLAGGENAQAAFAADIRSVLTQDYYGVPIDDLPLMQDVNSASDFDLVIGIGYAEELIRQFQSPYGVPAITGTWGMMGPHYFPYLDTGQLQGMVMGMRGGAEYEHMVGFVGEGLQGADALSMTHIAVAMFAVLGNLLYIYAKATGKEKLK